jgi:hypothetical protein
MQSRGTADARACKSFAEFYPFYLGEHSNRTCRRLHFLGDSLSLSCLGLLIVTGEAQYFLYALLCGYGFAWLGHFGFEKTGPVLQLHRRLVMSKDIWTGKIPF